MIVIPVICYVIIVIVIPLLHHLLHGHQLTDVGDLPQPQGRCRRLRTEDAVLQAKLTKGGGHTGGQRAQPGGELQGEVKHTLLLVRAEAVLTVAKLGRHDVDCSVGGVALEVAVALHVVAVGLLRVKYILEVLLLLLVVVVVVTR